jgi:hypothetical protein
MHLAKLTFRVGAEGEIFSERSVTAYLTDEDLDPTEYVRGKLPDATADQLVTIVAAERGMRFRAATELAVSGFKEPALEAIRTALADRGSVKLVFSFNDGDLNGELVADTEGSDGSSKQIDEIAQAAILNVHHWFSMRAREKFAG